MLKVAAFCAGLIIVVTAIWFVIAALSPSYNSCIQHNGQHPTEQYTGDGQQIVEGPIDNPTGFRLALVCGSNFANRNGEAFTGLFTVALTLATFLLGYLAWDQGHTSRAQLRAYVAFTPSSIGGILEQVIRIDGHTENYGETPAKNIWYEFDIGVFPNDRPREAAYPNPTEKITIEFGTFPKTRHISWFSKSITNEDMINIMSGTHRVHIWGVTHYRDAFRERHQTQFQAMTSDNLPDVVVAAATGQQIPAWNWTWGSAHHEGT